MTITSISAQTISRNHWITPKQQLDRLCEPLTREIVADTGLPTDVANIVAQYSLSTEFSNWYTALERLNELPDKCPPLPKNIYHLIEKMRTVYGEGKNYKILQLITPKLLCNFWRIKGEWSSNAQILPEVDNRTLATYSQFFGKLIPNIGDQVLVTKMPRCGYSEPNFTLERFENRWKLWLNGEVLTLEPQWVLMINGVKISDWYRAAGKIKRYDVEADLIKYRTPSINEGVVAPFLHSVALGKKFNFTWYSDHDVYVESIGFNPIPNIKMVRSQYSHNSPDGYQSVYELNDDMLSSSLIETPLLREDHFNSEGPIFGKTLA